MSKIWNTDTWGSTVWNWDVWADTVPLSIMVGTISVQPAYLSTISVARAIKSDAEISIDLALKADVEIKPET